MPGLQRGTITAEDREFIETWENIANHQTAIIHFDARGDEYGEVIQGRRSFMLTTEERLVMEGRIVEEKNNPFRNGDFRPVTVPENVTLETNPNALSDEEIMVIFESSDLAWHEWLSTLDSPATLRRMMDLAETAEISLRRYREIEQRMIDVNPRAMIRTPDGALRSPTAVVGTKDPHLANMLSDKGPSGARTTSSGAANPRRQGGMSSNYR